MARRALVLLLCLTMLVPVFGQDMPPAAGAARLSGPDPAQQALAEGWLSLSPALGEQPIYLEEPSAVAPYAIGALNPVYLETGLAYLNYARLLAGLSPVECTEHLCIQAQYGAVLLAATDTLSHTPARPGDMDASFYRMGANACLRSNLSIRYLYQHHLLLQSALRGYLDETSTANRIDLGHRRWLLDPRLGRVGFGLATSASGRQYIAVPVTDRSARGAVPAAVCWPAAGSFPNTMLSPETPWSVILDPEVYALPDFGQLTVTVTRLWDGASVTPAPAPAPDCLDGVTPYVRLSTAAYGLGPCITFSPGAALLDTGPLLGDYTVSISGLKTLSGADAPLTYTVRFFDPAALSAPSLWAEEELLQAEELGLLPDFLTDRYQQPITRLEFCRLAMSLLRQSGSDALSGLSPAAPFSDCGHPDVLAAAALGLVLGAGDGTFRPADSITRQDAATLLARLAWLLFTPTAAEPSAAGFDLAFADADAIAGYARPAVARLSALRDGITGMPVLAGSADGRFLPRGDFTREQAVLTALRLYRSLP